MDSDCTFDMVLASVGDIMLMRGCSEQRPKHNVGEQGIPGDNKVTKHFYYLE